VHIRIHYGFLLLGLLLGACASNPPESAETDDAAVSQSGEAIAAPAEDMANKTQPVGKKSSASSSVSKPPPLIPEYSELGKARARLLAEMNKSPTVELPAAEYLAQFDSGVTRVEQLSLFDAVALSLDYSNDVAASLARRDSTDYYTAASLGPLLPRIDLRFNTGTETSTPSSVTKAPTYNRLPEDTHKRSDYQIFIRQSLLDFPSYFERQRQNLMLEAAEHNLSNTQERVAYDTLVSFLKLVQLRLNVVLTEQYEADLKKLLNYMTARVQGGGATKADLQRVKGRVLNMTASVIEARGAYDSGLVEFKRLTGVVPSSVTIPGTLLPVLPSDFATAMAAAIEGNFELQSALRDVESVAQEKLSMQGRYSPKLELELSAQHTYNAGGVAGSDPPTNGKLYVNQDDKRAMVVMSWNLLNGGADLMQAKALEAKRMEYQYRADEIRRRLEESLRINFNALRAANGRISGVKQEIESNDIVLAAFNAQLSAANRSLLDVLDAYQRQHDAKTSLTRLLIAEATAGLQMLLNMGKLQEGIVALH